MLTISRQISTEGNVATILVLADLRASFASIKRRHSLLLNALQEVPFNQAGDLFDMFEDYDIRVYFHPCIDDIEADAIGYLSISESYYS